MIGVIKAICKEFGKVEQLEKYGGYMRLRVERQDKTIGSVFGMVEDFK